MMCIIYIYICIGPTIYVIYNVMYIIYDIYIYMIYFVYSFLLFCVFTIFDGRYGSYFEHSVSPAPRFGLFVKNCCHYNVSAERCVSEFLCLASSCFHERNRMCVERLHQ